MDNHDEQPLAKSVRLRGISACPYCHQGFGHASLPIHLGRCRALLPPTFEEVQAAEEAKRAIPIRQKVVHSLVDLCLRFVSRHFKSVCMDRMMAFPRAEAALIASLPSNLLHRMIVNVIEDNKRVNAKNRENRAIIEKLESTIHEAHQGSKQLESARNSAARCRVRMAEQQHVSERLQRELQTTKNALALTEVEMQQLQAKAKSTEKKLLWFEAKVNKLNVDKGGLEKALSEARRHEMEATRQLASAQKSAPGSIGTNNFGRRSGGFRHKLASPSYLSERKDSTDSTDSVKRPFAGRSKIPYPSSLHKPTQPHQNQDDR